MLLKIKLLNYIRFNRLAKGFRQYELAELAELNVKHLSDIETRKTIPRLDEIIKIAIVLCVDIEELFDFKIGE